jgi:hypothetical protein
MEFPMFTVSLMIDEYENIKCLIYMIVILIVIYTLKNNEINLFCYCCNW